MPQVQFAEGDQSLEFPLRILLALVAIAGGNQVGSCRGQIAQLQVGFADLEIELGKGLRPIQGAIDIQGIEQQGERQIGIIGLTVEPGQPDQPLRQPLGIAKALQLIAGELTKMQCLFQIPLLLEDLTHILGQLDLGR